MLAKVINKIKNITWNINHRRLNKKNRKRIRNKDISIISMNCTGGILLHDLGLKFLSPTVNLFMRAEDFIKFCENLEYYLSIDKFVECHDKFIIEDRTYPIGYLDDLTIFSSIIYL